MEQSLRQGVTEWLAELETSTERAAHGLARRRTAPSNLRRNANRRIPALPDAPIEGMQGSPGFSPDAALETVTRSVQRASGWQDVTVRLAHEGLGDVAIARQRRVGLEDVRRTLGRHASWPADRER